jgi:hypothetical protein
VNWVEAELLVNDDPAVVQSTGRRQSYRTDALEDVPLAVELRRRSPE